MHKRVMTKMRMYEHRQKIAYKCASKKCGYNEVDEAYTTKCCSKCGYFNKHITKQKIFNCISCGYVSDRDDNSTRCIMMRAMA